MGMREISGQPRCIPENLDCEDFVYSALYNDIADNTTNALGRGTHLASGVGVRYNSYTQEWIYEQPNTGGVPNILAFEMMPGQNRFRLLTELSVPLCLPGVVGFFPDASRSASIVFMAHNISKSIVMGSPQKAMLLQVFRDKTFWETSRAIFLNSVPTGTILFPEPYSVPPYQIDLQNVGGLHKINFEADIPADIFPNAGQTDVIELRVFRHNFNSFAHTVEHCFINFAHLSQILEPS